MLNDSSLRKILIKAYKLTPAEERLFFTIREIYFFWGNDRACYASNETLMNETNMSSGTVGRALKALESKKLIKLAYEKTKGFLSRRNIYPLEDELLKADAQYVMDEREQLMSNKNEVYADHYADQYDQRTLIKMKDHADQNDHINNHSLNNYNLNNKNNICDDQNDHTYVDSRIEGADAPVGTSSDLTVCNPHHKVTKSNVPELAMSRWNNEIAPVFNLPKVVKITPKRRKAILAVLDSVDGLENWIIGIKHQLSNSKFHRGENDRHWKADFDYYCRSEKALKALEGALDPQSAVCQIEHEEGYVDKMMRQIFENYSGDKKDLILSED